MEGYELSMATRSFKVFKLRDDEEGDRGVSSRFVEVKDLNGDAVFVGDNYLTAVRAREFEGVRSDSVYYTDDFSEFNFPDVNLGPHDVGVFNVKEKKFGSFYVSTPAQNRDMPPPIWIFPTIAPDMD
ncbi:unnamed protein product [Linum tenue]|uniref:KIB1-4 beta-propeller domain-containing protein n=1 Tax=Linum tenue TaxID=586396 RepID=A0AAV0QR66_9ROSI|nr:unnamed protein product [Linum tenue]